MSGSTKTERTGPNWGATILRCAIGTYLGGMIGTVLLPGVGTAIGAKLGAVLAGASAADGADGADVSVDMS